jgi:hypothetical protein
VAFSTPHFLVEIDKTLEELRDLEMSWWKNDICHRASFAILRLLLSAKVPGFVPTQRKLKALFFNKNY